MTDQHQPEDVGADIDAPPPLPPPTPPPEPLPDEGAPEEVQQDAIAELDRIHSAARFDTAPFGGAQPGFDASYGMSAPTSPGGFTPLDPPEIHREPEPAVPHSRELRSLDDLYATYPIGDGNHFLRIERKHPTRFRGQYVAGYLCDVHEQLSMVDFARRFGGQVYTVSVCGPGRGTSLDADGRATIRTLNTIQIKVPGIPLLDSMENPSNGGGSPPMGQQSWTDPRIEMKRMDLDHDALRRAEQREERLRREVASRSALSPELMREMNEMAERRAGETRSAHAEIIADVRQRNGRLEASIREKDKQIDDLRQQLVHTQTDVQQRLREEETRQVKELKLQHETSIARVKEDHAAAIQRMQNDHERRINEMTERHSRDIQTLRDTEQRERERLRDDANRREKNLQDDFARREQAFRDRESSLRDDFSRREDSVRRDYEMRLQALERGNKRDLEMIRSNESTKVELVNQTAQMQASLHMQEIARLTAQAESAEAQTAEAHRELSKFTNKPLLEQVAETKQIAETLGMLDKKEEDFDWKKAGIGAIKDLIAKGPDIARGLGEAREQNRVAVVRAQRAAEQARARAEMAQRRRVVQQGAQPMSSPPQQQRIAPPPPPPGMTRRPQAWDAGPPEPGHASHLPPEPMGPPTPQVPAPTETPMTMSPQTRPGTAPPARVTGGPAPPIAPAVATQLAQANSISPSGGDAAAPTASRSPAVPTPPGMVAASDMVTAAPDAQPSPPMAPQEAPQETLHQPQDPQQSEGAEGIQVTEEQVERFSTKLEQAIDFGVSAETFAAEFIEEVGPEVTLKIIMSVHPDALINAVAAQPGADKSQIPTRAGRKFVHELWGEAHRQALAKLGYPQ